MSSQTWAKALEQIVHKDITPRNKEWTPTPLRPSTKRKMKITKSNPISYEHDIHINETKDYEKVVLLLHGFQLNGKFMFKRFEKLFSSNTLVMAPNAPFVVPLKKDDGWEARYGWYFYDPDKRNFYINYEPASYWLCDIVRELNKKRAPVTIIGYSQGGFIAPKVAESLTEVEKVIAINSIFRSERFSIRKEVTYSQVHGKLDSLVSFEDAQEEFNKMQELGAKGDFLEVEEDHFLNRNLVKSAMKMV
ncbi:MAG: hypothetical protein CME64_11550 [Halobacteriovoraceae bacterium]|nr:hypothetical protein [Halobacteriovoraceae bacterium]